MRTGLLARVSVNTLLPQFSKASPPSQGPNPDKTYTHTKHDLPDSVLRVEKEWDTAPGRLGRRRPLHPSSADMPSEFQDNARRRVAATPLARTILFLSTEDFLPASPAACID